MRTEQARRWLLIGLIALALPAQADWKRDYDRGRKALEDKQWSEAESSFRAALKDDGTPSERKRFEGMRFDVYVPHYYAGLAAYRQGACDRALEYWGHGATNAVLGKLPNLQAEQRSGLGECQTRLAAAQPPPAADSAVAANVPNTGATTAPSADASKPTAASDAPQSSPPTTAAVNQPTSPTTVAVAPPKPEIAKPTPPPTQPAPTQAAAKAPGILVNALDLYVSGRYTELLRIDPATLDARARAHVLLLRAAARYTLAELAGADTAGFEEARRDVRLARAAQSSLSPEQVLFSPKFREFYQRTR